MVGALALLGWIATVNAGTLYVNGVRADGLRDFQFEGVDVRVDAKGDIWVDAPRYKVEVDSPGSSAAPAGASPSGQGQAPSGTYWLVTEDHDSVGQDVDVIVNGALVYTVRSGQGQVIVDLGRYLRRGTNAIILHSQGGAQGGGGVLNIYVGTGSNQSGTVVLDTLQVNVARRAQDAARASDRTFQLVVP